MIAARLRSTPSLRWPRRPRIHADLHALRLYEEGFTREGEVEGAGGGQSRLFHLEQLGVKDYYCAYFTPEEEPSGQEDYLC